MIEAVFVQMVKTFFLALAAIWIVHWLRASYAWLWRRFGGDTRGLEVHDGRHEEDIRGEVP